MGIDTDTNYPYTDKQGTCKADRNQEVTIDRHAMVPPYNEKALRKQVAKQPVGSGLDASGHEFQLYTGGIHRAPCTTIRNHAVTIVGYDSEASEDYWIIKNTYGKKWGEEGYLKLPRNVAERDGKCGIAQWPLYPKKSQNPKSSQSILFTIEGKIYVL
ncbi:hypothetical protein Taro_022655 [Colocasia esculenta]|uniref:Peptidase C1A papain C-terminal domain-containing protein n=1 Tax=Colocasia esculenta TaxID=4460 RepID=A0A843V8Z8_COLES|nr:hypothetical protein [Colocasia esculenta]